jgi:hypothetical protein
MIENAIPPNADRSMSTCGIRWPVTLTDAPASVMIGPAETDTAVSLRADKTRESGTSDDSEGRTTAPG